MKVIADLHLHSKYSRAVSQKMEPLVMVEWAIKKGIDLLATADWTHPLWLKELEANLEEAGGGIYGIKTSLKSTPLSGAPREVFFILSTEISSIYSQGGKVRRIHNVILAPSFTTVHKINDELKRRGANLMADGRPIIGLSSQALCELIWSIDENCILVPAHVWTPWFSLYGSKSGFDSIDECFGQFAPRIYAVETGLSSDPAMNWRIKELDSRSIVSNSDAHSPAKMGREATVFELEELSFNSINTALRSMAKFDPVFESRTRKSNSPSSLSRDAINTKTLSNLSSRSTHQQLNNGTMKQSSNRILYTIEFHPEEGKYHYTGHRNCGIRQAPEETHTKGTTCPICGKPLTVGVMHRVEQLAAGRQIPLTKKENEVGLVGFYNAQNTKRPPYVMLVPLMEILAESLKSTTSSQKVIFEYENLTKNLAPEFELLTQTKIEAIERLAGSRVAEGIKKVRKGDIVIEPGFDGVFGVVKIWPAYAKASAGKPSSNLDKAVNKQEEQMSLL